MTREVTVHEISIFFVVPFIGFGVRCGAQIQVEAPRTYTFHATLSDGNDGQIVLTASSPRPVLQAMDAARLKYGWVVDYEEGKYSAAQIEHDPEGHVFPRGGTFVLNIVAPRDSSISDERAFLAALATRGSAAIGLDFSVLDNSRGRYTLKTVTNSEALMLDTPVKLNYGTRTVDGTIQAIVDLVSKKRGAPFLWGGLIDNGLIASKVTMGGETETPARNLLMEALDSCPIARVWAVTYEPSDGNFYLGIEPALKTGPTYPGGVKTVPTWNDPIIKTIGH